MVLTVVIDTNIYISAIFWNGKPREVIDLGRQGKIVIFTSVDIENEIARKLKTKFKLADPWKEEQVRKSKTLTQQTQSTL